MKPRLRVSVMMGFITSEAVKPVSHFMISAVNFGPGVIRPNIIWYKKTTFLKSVFRKFEHGVVIHDYNNPLSGKLPTVLEVGEKVVFLFPWNDKSPPICVNPSHIGIKDSFGRIHWAPRKEVKKVNKKWHEEFGAGIDKSTDPKK